MEKEKILKQAQKGKHPIGEMEKSKINVGNWISLIVACVFAVALMIVEGSKKHFDGIYAIASICYLWASVFFFCQYFIAKRKWQVLIGAVLHSIGFITMFTFYILYSVGVL